MGRAELVCRPLGPRNVTGTVNWPPDMVSMFGALLTIWSNATSEKENVMNSIMGRRPAIAAPTPRPANPASAMGASITRLGPNFSSSPWLIL